MYIKLRNNYIFLNCIIFLLVVLDKFLWYVSDVKVYLIFRLFNKNLIFWFLVFCNYMKFIILGV